METKSHLTDAFGIQVALRSGQVQPPRPEWDADSQSWLIRARSRAGGADWVLTRGGPTAAFPSLEQARRAADGLRSDGFPYLIGQR